MMRELTREERQHPDVRAVWPHLCGVRQRSTDYKLSDILGLWAELWQGKDFFPVLDLPVPGRTAYADDCFWISNRCLESIMRGDPCGLDKGRSGEETTTNLLCDPEKTPDERVAIFLFAMLKQLDPKDYDINPSNITRAIFMRTLNGLCRGTSVVQSYHWRCSSFLPWYLPKGMPDRFHQARSLRELIALCVEAAKILNEQGRLVILKNAPDEVLARRRRKQGIEQLRRSIAALEAGNLQGAADCASAAAEWIQQSIDLERVARIKQDR